MSDEELCLSPILNDQPADEDALNFAPYRDTLADIINDPNTDTPLVIGVFGDWGSGKSTLMKLVQEGVNPKSDEEKKLRVDVPERRNHTIWFTAWKYDKEEVLWRALLTRVLAEVRPLASEDEDALQKLDDLTASLYRDVDREELGKLQVNWLELAKGSLESAIHVGLALVPGLNLLDDVVKELGKTATKDDPGKLLKAFERASVDVHKDHVSSLEQFQQEFAGLVDEHIVQKDGNLVIFVDDLDRCLPEKAIQVLEAIKLFLDVEGCIFVLGLDPQAIQNAVVDRYKDVEKAKQYIEKIIQVPFILPPIEMDQMEKFVGKVAPQLTDKRCNEVFALGLAPNPRQVKRTINVFLLLWRLTGRRKELEDVITPVRLAKAVVIQNSYRELYKKLQSRPQYLGDLERYFRAVEERRSSEPSLDQVQDISQAGGRQTEALPSLAPDLEPFRSQERLRAMLTMHPLKSLEQDDANFARLTRDQLQAYITLTCRVEPPVAEPEPTETKPGFEPQVMRIPKGAFNMGLSQEGFERLIQEEAWAQEWQEKGFFAEEMCEESISLEEFAIGKYPVTNAEYQIFLEENPDQPQPQHWTGRTYPDSLGEHPVIYVSWQDALAYCEWLSEKMGKHCRLPTESEWERAARGLQPFLWPWGNEFKEDRCNTRESGLGTPTPVGKYSPAGDSPSGCADMAGNVWEWCSTLWGKESTEPDFPYPYDRRDGRENLESEGLRVLRGGSWYFSRGYARCTFRYRLPPTAGRDYIGFRIAYSLDGTE
jgi:formylglycine-generating enzyme required for sulfatase activity